MIALSQFPDLETLHGFTLLRPNQPRWNDTLTVLLHQACPKLRRVNGEEMYLGHSLYHYIDRGSSFVLANLGSGESTWEAAGEEAGFSYDGVLPHGLLV